MCLGNELFIRASRQQISQATAKKISYQLVFIYGDSWRKFLLHIFSLSLSLSIHFYISDCLTCASRDINKAKKFLDVNLEMEREKERERDTERGRLLESYP